MLLFYIFHVFFSHQHVQMITGPHEKKWCGKIFWGPFLNKINFFNHAGAPRNIVQIRRLRVHMKKKLCGNFFWGPFLNKINFFKNYELQWIFKIENWHFAYVFMSYISTFSALPLVENLKSSFSAHPSMYNVHMYVSFSSNLHIRKAEKESATGCCMLWPLAFSRSTTHHTSPSESMNATGSKEVTFTDPG